jgi:hypothetical protein
VLERAPDLEILEIEAAALVAGFGLHGLPPEQDERSV